MTVEMKKYKLGDLGKIVTGKTPRTSIEENYGGDIPFITPSDDLSVKDIREVSKKITELGLKEVKNCLLPPRSICVSCIGSDMGKVVMTSVPSVTNQQFNSIIPNESFDADYIYYLMIPIGQQMKNKLGKQSTAVPIVSKSQFSDIDVSIICDIKDQKKVSSVLSSIDNRIENLRAQNRVLEQTAKTIYDYTFLQCVGHQTTYNKTLNRNIPADWEVKSVNQMAKSYRGVAYDKSDVQKENNGGILVLRGNNIQDNNLVYDGNVVYIPENLVEDNQHIKKGDIIMTMSSGSKEHIGKCTMFQYDSKHTYGAFLTKFTPNRECRYYFYMNLISDYFKAKIKSVCNGTGINNLTNQTFNEIFFPYPDSKTLDVFEKTVTPIFDKMGVNTKQIETLTTQRNTLLPLLMTGQVVID